MRPFSPQVEAEIRRIAQDAIALGWTPELLFQSSWNIVGIENRPGLAGCMRTGDRITDVTENYIEISRDGIKTKLYHPDREFPWRKAVRPGAKEEHVR